MGRAPVSGRPRDPVSGNTGRARSDASGNREPVHTAIRSTSRRSRGGGERPLPWVLQASPGCFVLGRCARWRQRAAVPSLELFVAWCAAQRDARLVSSSLPPAASLRMWSTSVACAWQRVPLSRTRVHWFPSRSRMRRRVRAQSFGRRWPRVLPSQLPGISVPGREGGGCCEDGGSSLSPPGGTTKAAPLGRPPGATRKTYAGIYHISRCGTWMCWSATDTFRHSRSFLVPFVNQEPAMRGRPRAHVGSSLLSGRIIG